MAEEKVCCLPKADDLSAVISEYAKEVTDFSSQYGSETSISYTACNLAQRNNIYPNYGDYTQACVFRNYGPWWNMAPSSKSKFRRTPVKFLSEDFIEVSFETKVYPLMIQVFETYNPGSVVRILACDTSSGTDVDTGLIKWAVLWEGFPENAPPCSRIFQQKWKMINFQTDLIRLEFCHAKADYYTELDSIKLHGTQQPHDCDVIAYCDKNISDLGLITSTAQQLDNLKIMDLEKPGFDRNVNDICSRGSLCQRSHFDTKSYEGRESSGDAVYNNTDYSGNGYFDLLPEEVIQEMLSYLDVPSLCNTAQTCRLLHEHCYDPLQFTELNLQPHWTKITDCALDSLHTRCHLLQRLNLSWCGSSGHITNEGLCGLLKVCGQDLTCLYMSCCHFVNNGTLKIIADSCPHLSELDIQSCRFIESLGILNLIKLKHLRRLNLYRTLVDMHAVLGVIRSSPELELLNLGSCNRISNFDDVAIELGKHCKNLQCLDLWRSRTMTEIGLRALANSCTQLEELDLGWCSELKSGTDCFTDLTQKCRMLKKLFLTANRTVCDHDLFAVANNCPLLEQLDILGTRQVSHGAALEVLQRCKNLKMFDVSFCAGIDLQTVQDWREKFPHVAIKKSFQAEPHLLAF